MKRNDYHLDDSLGYKLFQASRLMNSRLNRNFKDNDFNLSYEQWQVLSRLFDEDGQTQNQLAIRNERDQAGISRLIDNLIKRNLVRRVPQKDDRRVNLIYLTEETKAVQHELEALATMTINQASMNIDPKELEITLRILDQIRKNLE
ncbi:MarR family winged helix-turn-helix transcriptional regulator [Jeotgalibacillus soli]|nr:MarR family transcriptional regulator [Jeotgalibacillus soli]